MQVNHRCFQLAVAKEFFNGVDVGTGIKQMSSKRMPQGMSRIILSAKTDFADITLYKILDAALPDIYRGRLCIGFPLVCPSNKYTFGLSFL